MSGAVIVGLGNVLLGDDGVGPAVCDELRRREAAAGQPRQLPVGVELLDGGTLGTALIPWLLDAGAAVIVDAVRARGQPGDVLVDRGCGRWVADPGASEVESLVQTAILGGLPRDAITLVGIIPGPIRPGRCLSPAVSAAVPSAASLAAREVRSLTGGGS